MTEHNLPDKDDAPWLDCMDGFKTEANVTRTAQESRAKSSTRLNQFLMTDPSPITPPPELVRQWQEESLDDPTGAYSQAIANRAAQWGYLQHEKALLDAMHSTELPPSLIVEPTNHLMTDNQTDWRALCDELLEALYYETGATSGDWTMLRAKAEAALAQPKPPSLKEQALIVLDDANLDAAHENILRRALEALPDD